MEKVEEEEKLEIFYIVRRSRCVVGIVVDARGVHTSYVRTYPVHGNNFVLVFKILGE